MSSRQRAAKNLPPLAVSLTAVVAALVMLPSAFNLPQANPSTTLEFAPVPQDGNGNAPGGGNVAAVGDTASSNDLGGGPVHGRTGPPPPPPPPLKGTNPVDKQCVGNPPRQTEDPLSPPCVSFFKGDNFGSTYQGVTGNEIRVLFYFDGCEEGTCQTPGGSRGAENVPTDVFYDLGQPGDDSEYGTVRALRVWQTYFNARYQTYGRRAHFFVQFGSAGYEPEMRRSDAVKGLSRVHPFAVASYADRNGEAYVQAVTQRGVVTFVGGGGGSNGIGQSESLFARSPGLLWSYEPSIEQRARMFSSYVCTKVVRKPVSSATASDNGTPLLGAPRKLGMLHTNDPLSPGLVRFAKLVKAAVERCGGVIAKVGLYPKPGQLVGASTEATQNMAQFQREGITTIIWPGGFEFQHGQSAGRIRYFPEIVYAGDGREQNFVSRLQDRDFWRQTWVLTTNVRVSRIEDAPCYVAAKQADPSAPSADVESYGCGTYATARQIFTGIQVAGPRLRPQSIDQGFHAIPPVRSPDPRVPACFYDDGDYTCVKDDAAEYWDPARTAQDGTPGCYRMPEGGRRYLPGTWPDENVDARRSDADGCNIQG